MMKAPGSLSFSSAMAGGEKGRAQTWRGERQRALRHRQAHPQFTPSPLPRVTYTPCSREMSGLYQYLEVSCTNFTLARVSGLMSAGREEEKKNVKGDSI